MDKKEHIDRHIILHKNLDELLVDFIGITKKLPSQTTIIELMDWSYQQTKNPTENQCKTTMRSGERN